MLYKFGPFTLDNREQVLWRDGQAVPIMPKGFAILELLVNNSGHLLEKSYLKEKLWPDTYIAEGTLAQHISNVRRLLGPMPSGQPYIQTITKRGYRFVAAVEMIDESAAPADKDGYGGNQATADAEDSNALPGEAITREGEIRINAQSTNVIECETSNQRIKSHTHLKKYLLVLLAVAACGALSFLLLKFKGRGRSQGPIVPFQSVKISNVTASGNIWATAVSPDGNYVAYVVVNNEQFSLYVKQIDTASQLELLSLSDSQIAGLTFSPSGEYIFYNQLEAATNTRLLYQISMFRGTSKLILRDIDSPITFSPDGKRIAFIRELTPHRETALVLANSDGSEQKTLITRKSPSYYVFDGPAWSPDGKSIACAAGNSGGHMSLIEVSLKDGVEREITRPLWDVAGKVVWLANGKGLILSASDESNSAEQLWRISYPSGDASKITDGSSRFIGQSLSADSRVLISIESDQILEVFIAAMTDLAHPRRLAHLGGRYSLIDGFSLTADGEILYAPETDENCHIWSSSADGTVRRQLSTGPGQDIFPTLSPDGRRVAFISERNGSQQLRVMDIDGSNQRQLNKNGPAQVGAKVHLHWTPDSQWIIYTLYGDKPTIWKTPIDGGAPVQLTTTYSYGGAISPNGNLLSYFFREDKVKRVKLAVVNLNTNRLIAAFDMPGRPYGAHLQWKADSSALSYIVNLDRKAYLLEQPIAGGAPRELLNLQPGLIEFFALSPDQAQLMYANTIKTYDVTKTVDLNVVAAGN